nr:hypothetical protein [Tanacetum cinerariifolium]
MSRDVFTVDSTMKIPLLYREEYSRWVERFMKYLEEQTGGETMINCIKNGDQPLPRVTQVSIVGTSSTQQPPLKDKSIKNTAKDLWDALARHMLGSEYGKQDGKATILYKYETFKATEGELLLDTYIRYLQVINALKKCGYSKVNCELNFKFLNNLQPEWKQYATMMRQNKNLMDINTDALYNILKQNQGVVNDAINNLRTSFASQSANKKQEFVKSNDKKVEKKDDEKRQDMSKVKCYNCKKEGHFAKDCKKFKVKDYEYYKTKIDSDQEINANMVFMAQINKVLLDSEASSSSVDDKIPETVHMIMPSKDNLYNGRKGIGFENPSYFEKAQDLRPSLYDEKVIGLGYTPIFFTHSDEALEIEKFKSARENKIDFAYDYGNLNANLDTFSSVRRPKQSNVIWKKKWSSNTSNDDLSSVSHLKLNKDVKRYSRKDLLSCNNSHLEETSSAYDCNDAMNVSCNSRLYDSFDENSLFIFDDESVRISPVSNMPFRKKPCNSLNVHYKRNLNKSLPRTVRRWLLKMQQLAEPVAKWIVKVKR